MKREPVKVSYLFPGDAGYEKALKLAHMSERSLGNMSMSRLASDSLADARARRRVADLVGKTVRLVMPPKLKRLVPSDTGTLVSAQGRQAQVRIGTVTHTINGDYVREHVA